MVKKMLIKKEDAIRIVTSQSAKYVCVENPKANIKDVANAVGNIIFALDQLSPADAVQVVRCKECKWHEDTQPKIVYCPNVVGGWVSEDFYCGAGERRENETDR